MTLKPTELALVGALALAFLVGAYLGYRHWRRRKAERDRLRAISAIGYDMIRDVLLPEWAVMNGSVRSTFQNPLGQLYDRLAVVRQVAGKVPVDGRVVFTARGSFPRGRPKRVVMLDSLDEEFPLADRRLDPSPAAAWAEDWARLREVATPSPIVPRR